MTTPSGSDLYEAARRQARLYELAQELADFVARVAQTTVGHGCVPLDGVDGEPGFIADARALLARLEG